jgi:heptosyltransferase-1
MRGVVAAALGHTNPGPLDYGLTHTWAGRASGEVVLIHSTSASDKLWPEEHWITIGRQLIAQGMAPVLPWGSDSEKERSVRLAQAMGAAALVPPRRTISQWTQVISRSALVVGVDTGLTHLAAAAGVPCLAIFAATGSKLFAPQNPDLAIALGGSGQAAALQAVQDSIESLLTASQAEPA